MEIMNGAEGAQVRALREALAQESMKKEMYARLCTCLALSIRSGADFFEIGEQVAVDKEHFDAVSGAYKVRIVPVMSEQDPDDVEEGQEPEQKKLLVVEVTPIDDSPLAVAKRPDILLP